jgi:hypothetical protein
MLKNIKPNTTTLLLQSHINIHPPFLISGDIFPVYLNVEIPAIFEMQKKLCFTLNL